MRVGTCRTSRFQSAPLTKARGDRLICVPIGRPSTFQSAPLTKARGDSAGVILLASSPAFQSAPLTKARGDLPMSLLGVGIDGFQSAPLTKARGDGRPVRATGAHLRFNPLPSQKQGETASPRPREGRLNVSIRSPHKSKGRRGRDGLRVLRTQFQSAPLTKARGDS